MSPHPTRSGYTYGLGALTAWGLLPVYWKQLAAIPSLELIGHRATWSVLFLLVLCALRGEGRELLSVLKAPKRALTLAFTGSLIASNWLVYVWGVNNGRLLESSFGYFLSPLLTIALGALLLREHLSARKKCAVGLAATGVVLKAVSAGVVPWLGLYLACSMSFYGFVRKKLGVSSLVGLTVETMLLFPVALGYLGYLSLTNDSHFLGAGMTTTVLLALTGVCTSLPLMWFVRAGQLLPLSTLGILQYLSPTLQLVLAVAFFGETMTTGALVSFVLIWVAIGAYLYGDRLSQPVAARTAA
jgi:chloramphenicol-sensitive protein RarD